MKTIKTLTMGICLTAMSFAATAQTRDWGCDDDVMQATLESVSLYQEDVKQWKASKDSRYLEEAYPYWKTIVSNARARTSTSTVPTF